MRTKDRVTAISERVSFVELDIEQIREDIREMLDKLMKLAELGCEKTVIINVINRRVRAMAKKLNIAFNEFDEIIPAVKMKKQGGGMDKKK